MIGIDLSENGGFVAAFQRNRPTILGEGGSIAELVQIAKGQAGEESLLSTVAITVPAWFNDVQRKSVFEEAKAAGLTKIRLINRPTAVAFAYSALDPAERTALLVLEFQKDRLDVTVLAKTPEGFEVLGADGGATSDGLTVSDPDKLFGELESAIDRVLKHAGVEREQLSDLLCAGCADRIEAIQTKLAGAFGRKGSTRVQPERAAALGAAVIAALIQRGAGAPVVPQQTEGAPTRGSGCLALLVIGALMAILFH
jgi:molecular chaperone DnaK (HSP70)